MGSVEKVVRPTEVTPVDDVRRVREKLSAQCGDDVSQLAEHARRLASQYRTKLNLKPVGTATEA